MHFNIYDVFTVDSYVTSLAETLCGHKRRRVLNTDAAQSKHRLSSERRHHTRELIIKSYHANS